MNTNQLDRIEAKVDHILMQLNQGGGARMTTPMPTQPETKVTDASQLFHNWTIKQHCVMQMVLRGASNDEISERMGVTLNTAKVHVRTLARKLGVSTRSEIVAACLIPFRDVSEEAYMMMARGLTKTWDAEYAKPDPFHDLIHGKSDA